MENCREGRGGRGGRRGAEGESREGAEGGEEGGGERGRGGRVSGRGEALCPVIYLQEHEFSIPILLRSRGPV